MPTGSAAGRAHIPTAAGPWRGVAVQVGERAEYLYLQITDDVKG